MLVLGAAYMLYLAWHIWRAGPAEAREGRTGFVPGLLLQFVNPKIYIYGIVSMEAYILPNVSGGPVCPGAGLYRLCADPVLVRLRLLAGAAVLRPRQGGESGHGAAAGVVRGIAVLVT